MPLTAEDLVILFSGGGGAASVPVIGFRTGATATQTAVAHTVQPTLAVPAGVQPGDLLTVAISVFTFTPTTPDFTLTATSGHAWSPLGGGLQNSGAANGLNLFSRMWARTATAGDAGDTLTFAFTGTQGATDQFWWAIGIVAYTGAIGADVVAAPAAGNNISGVGTVTQPSVNTIASGDWELDVLATALISSGTITSPPAGKTLRENANTAGIALGVADSNAAVGGPGTPLGGGSFVSSGGFQYWVAWTIGLAP